MNLINSIKLERPTLKRGLEIAGRMTGVRLVKDRVINLYITKSGHFFIFTNEGDAPYTFFHKQVVLEHSSKEISLQVNPKEIVDAFKGAKGNDITLEVYESNDGAKVTLNEVDVDVTLLEERNFSPKKRVFIEAENGDEKVELIKTLGNSITDDVESVEVGGRFLKLKSPNFLKSNPLNISIDRVIIDPTGFETASKQITWLKSSENKLFFFSDGSELAIRAAYEFKDDTKNHEQLFLFSSIRNDTQKITEYDTKKVYSFSIDATKMNDILKTYKKEHSFFYLSSDNGLLKIDPYGSKEAMVQDKEKKQVEFNKNVKNKGKEFSWESEVKHIDIKTIDYLGDNLNLARTKLSADSLKVFFNGYKGDIVVEVMEFEYDNRDFYKLRCSHQGLDSMAMIIKEPNYIRIQSELSSIIEHQKKLSYI